MTHIKQHSTHSMFIKEYGVFLIGPFYMTLQPIA